MSLDMVVINGFIGKLLMKKHKLLGAILLAPLVTVAVAATALATPSSGLVPTTLSVGRFGEFHVKTNAEPDHQIELKTKGDSDVYVVNNTFAPGGTSGWHTHPGPSLITVKSGTITAYEGDDPTCTPHAYTAGQGFVDPGDGHVHLLRNEGTADAVTVVVQIIPAGAPRRIDVVPAPGNCPF
jgi:quercetin dioxygenase-like cupin family protein